MTPAIRAQLHNVEIEWQKRVQPDAQKVLDVASIDEKIML